MPLEAAGRAGTVPVLPAGHFMMHKRPLFCTGIWEDTQYDLLFFSHRQHPSMPPSALRRPPETIPFPSGMADGRRSFTLKEHENFEIVMPPYFQGITLFLQEFLETLTLTVAESDHYAFALICRPGVQIA